MADENLNNQPRERAQDSANQVPRRQGSHFAVPVSDELNDLMDQLEGPSSPQRPAAAQPDDDLEAIAAAYVSSTGASSRAQVPAYDQTPHSRPADQQEVPSYEQAPAYNQQYDAPVIPTGVDEEVPSFSSEPSVYTPNPNLPPLQGAVPVAVPRLELSDSPGDTIPQPLEDLSDRINTEGPALRTEEVFVVPEAPLEPQRDALGASGPFEPVKIQTATSQETGAPRPINVDPSSTGAFHTLSAGEGAVIPTRDTAASAKDAALSNLSEGEHSRRSGHLRDATSHQVASSQSARARRSSEPNKKLIVAILAIALLLGAAGFFFATQVMQKGGNRSTQGGGTASVQVVGTGESVKFGGYEYDLQQDQNGIWSIMRSPEGNSSKSAIATLPGTPVALALYGGALYVPENLEGSWDVMALMIADGSELTQIKNGDGTLFGGQGAAASAVVNGEMLTVTDANGQSFSFSLAV